MRTFVAIDLPKEVKDYLFNLQKKIKGAKVNWVAKKNIHLTLKYLGEISEEKVESLKNILKEIKFKPFKVKLHKVSFFLNGSYPTVIWVNLKPETNIIEIQKQVDSTTLNISALDTRFQTHVTLGRVKEIKNNKEFKNSIENIKIEPIEFEIKEFKLFKSVLSKDGPSYHVVDTFK